MKMFVDEITLKDHGLTINNTIIAIGLDKTTAAHQWPDVILIRGPLMVNRHNATMTCGSQWLDIADSHPRRAVSKHGQLEKSMISLT